MSSIVLFLYTYILIQILFLNNKDLIRLCEKSLSEPFFLIIIVNNYIYIFDIKIYKAKERFREILLIIFIFHIYT